MEFSKFSLLGIVTFMFLSVAASGRLLSYDTRHVPSVTKPRKSLDPFRVMEGSFISRGYGALNAFNHGNKRQVSSSPNQAESPHPLPPAMEQSFVPNHNFESNNEIKRQGSSYEIKRQVLSEPNPKHNFGSNYDIKRQVPSGPNEAESPDPVPPAMEQSFVSRHNFGSNYDIKRQVPSGPNEAESPDPVPPAMEQSFVPKHNFGSNYEIKRQVPSGPNEAESPDPPGRFH